MPKINKRFALRVNKISKSFEDTVILDDVSFSMYFGEKIALIGQNGEGKSTLVRLITGDLQKDTGEINLEKDLGISYLPQEFDSNQKIEDFLNLKNLTEKDLGEIKSLIYKLNLPEDILERSFGSLSGGQRSKLALVKIKLSRSDVVILDEPTNNLDLSGIKFLEEIVLNSKKSFLIVSHDRKFLDNTASKIIKLENGKIKTYSGNYSDYLEQRDKEEKLMRERYQSHIEKENKMKKAHMYKLAYKQKVEKRQSDKRKMSHKVTDKGHLNKMVLSEVAGVAGREARIFGEKLQKLENDRPNKNSEARPLKIDFSEMKRSGDKVLEIDDLEIRNGNFELGPISEKITREDRVLVMGDNGAGKSTLVKKIMESLNNENKNISWGVNINVGYLPQDLFFAEEDQDFLNIFLDKTEKDQTNGRKILSRFGFTKEDIFKKVSEFSPGMRSRAIIAIMLANNPNLLILDEPTNSLDMEVLSQFEKALQEYSGTIICISHDRYFIEKMKFNKEIKL